MNHFALSVEVIDDACTDDMLLPAQFTPAPDLDTPERRLCWAVFLDAWRMTYGNNQRERDDAEAWFESDARVTPFDFLGICDVLGLNPTRVRRHVRRYPLPNRIQSANGHRGDFAMITVGHYKPRRRHA